MSRIPIGFRNGWGWWLGAVILLALVYEVWPQLDLQLASWLFVLKQNHATDQWPWVQASYHAVPWLGRMLLVGCLLCLWGPGGLRATTPRTRRSAMSLLAGLLIGLTLIVNLTLKEVWGRARPHQVAELGGSQRYTPPLHPGDGCSSNCSFTSGHAATGFVLICMGALGSVHRRRLWWLAGSACGFMVGAGRMLQGDHFLGDVLFSWLILWGIALGVRAVTLRWRWRIWQAGHKGSG